MLNFTSGFQSAVDTIVARSSVMDVAPALIPIYPTKTAADAQGIGPDPVIASDNTLGAYSPYEGRLYVTYVDRITAIDTTPPTTPTSC